MISPSNRYIILCLCSVYTLYWRVGHVISNRNERKRMMRHRRKKNSDRRRTYTTMHRRRVTSKQTHQNEKEIERS